MVVFRRSCYQECYQVLERAFSEFRIPVFSVRQLLDKAAARRTPMGPRSKTKPRHDGAITNGNGKLKSRQAARLNEDLNRDRPSTTRCDLTKPTPVQIEKIIRNG